MPRPAPKSPSTNCCAIEPRPRPMSPDVNIAAGEALPLARAMIRCPSVTPTDGGALDVLQQAAESLGFVCHRVVFGDGEHAVDNLYARLGTAAPNFCFAGH